MAGLSCGMKCLKYLLFAFNFIIWVCGIAVLGVGIYSRIKISDWDSIIDDSTIPNAANIMIAAGIFVMVIGFLGCCGAWKENKCLLISYAITLILIFVLEIAAGIFAYTKKDDVINSLKEGLNKSIKETYGNGDPSNKGASDAIDWFQENVKCCGVDSYKDWLNTTWFDASKSIIVPKSCCINQDILQCNKGVDIKLIYTKGCVSEGEQFVKDHMFEIGGVGVGIAFVQLLGIVIAILLCRAIGYESV